MRRVLVRKKSDKTKDIVTSTFFQLLFTIIYIYYILQRKRHPVLPECHTFSNGTLYQFEHNVDDFLFSLSICGWLSLLCGVLYKAYL